ncbi:type I polyketide synthase [Streptomyces griseocarneus]|uniref:type I polyketide synthase n=1 Tax=Streptomyces griseocarneus TaxID=51201 RepID=UPI00167D600C|nr:type I polyketide synthase [Streptomyces griseocarneus]MBZ6478131.1 KR domain-containing protein [Streptomyces griseocarneus]GHG53608.1 hypothetical protein GCM10018779_15710 [Streptomyces griseocarneus]
MSPEPGVPMPEDDVERRLADDPVAIVGVAGMFPGAGNIRAFWDNVVAGRDCTAEVPPQWWSVEDHYDPDPFAPDKTYARRGAFLSPVVFDPREFGMPPNTVDSTGLVQLLGLMVARDVLRDAGCADAAWYDPARTGVVLGVCGTNSTLIPLAARLLGPSLVRAVRENGGSEEEARRIARGYLEGLPPWTEDSFPGILGNVVSGRIANRFDLGAANHTVDAACASSLAAVRSAVDELTARRADMMITGGCDADNSVVSFLCFSKTPALSPTGRVRPFDAEADGTLVGEGIGMLALRRLADAERAGQRVYAVIRGLGGSSDGRGTSIYAPCGAGQLTALRRAYRDAGCPPRSVGLIEAHGTGTPAGDEVELAALNELLAQEGSGDGHRVAVGSVKSQIGHTKAAAGAAGLIKAALALHQKVLPPTVNVTRPGAEATREGSALYVNTAVRPWIRDPGRPPRRAGVSAFGFGGVNHHAVLEEYAGPGDEEPYVLHRTPRACLWHAAGPEELLARLERGEAPDDGPAPAAHARLGFVSTDDEHHARLLVLAAEQLRNSPGHTGWRHARGIHYRRTALPAGTGVGALFAGQGSQYPGMGLGALLAVPPARAAFDAAGALFPPGDPLARTVFPPPGTDDALAAEERLRRTAYAQPAIGALAMGQYRFLSGLGFAPHRVLGHSFGELTALWAAGVLGDDAFLTLARARGLAMQAPDDGRDPGASAAVRGTEAQVRELLAGRPGLSVSCRNAPDEQVVGGPTPEVERFVRHCAERSVPVRRLPVAAAFHTPHIAFARDSFAAACAEADFGVPAVPVLAGAAGAAYGPDPGTNRRTITEQLCRPVDFAGRVREMYDDGVRVFVEFGPKRVLTGLVERTLDGLAVETVPCDTGATVDSGAALKEAALRLAVLGLPLTGINRYDAPAEAEPSAPSKAARLLEGPNFAALRRARTAERHAGTARDRGGEATPPGGGAGAGAGAEALTRAAADHLAAHVRFLDGQLATAEELTGLLRAGAANGGLDASLSEAVRSIAEHSVALGEAHTRAGEVVTRLLRLPGYDGEVAAVPPAPVRGRPGGPPPGLVREPPHAPDPEDADAPGRPSALAELLAAHRGETPPDGGPRPAPGPGPETAPTEVDREALEQLFRQVVAEKTGYDVDMIEPDMYILEDLGIDSLKQVEIGAEIWRRYPTISREDLFGFSEARTVRDLAEMLEGILTGSGRGLRRSDDVPLGRAFAVPRTLPAVDVRPDAWPGQRCALVLDDGGGLGEVLEGALRTRGWRVCRLSLPGVRGDGAPPPDDDTSWSLADWTETALTGRLGEILAAAGRVDLCVVPVSRDEDASAGHLVTRLQHAVLVAKHLASPLEEAAASGSRAGFVTVTRLDGCLGYAGAGGNPVAALAGGLGGLVKTMALEAAPVFCRALDFAPGMSAAAVAEAFVTEIEDAATDVREVGRDGETRRTPSLADTPGPMIPSPPETQGTPETPEAHELGPDDLLLVTGGASGITAWCVSALAAEQRCGYLLLGRTELADEPEWAAGLEGADALRGALAGRLRAAGEDPDAPPQRADADRRVREVLRGRRIRATLEELRSRGVEARYLAADVRDADALARVLRPYAERVTGVVHAAAVLGDTPLAGLRPESVAEVIGTKVSGLSNVLGCLDQERLRHLVLFTSVSGFWGNVRQADYALANEALNRFACAFKAARPACRVVPLVWGPWEGGMAAPMREIFVQQGVPVLARDVGCAYFVDRMRPGAGDGGVVVIGPTRAPYRLTTDLPARGTTVRRSLAALEREPVLLDHRWAGAPLLPMTAAVGLGLHIVERAQGEGRTVVECRDFRIRRGLYLDGSHPRDLTARLVPSRERASAEVAVTVRALDDGRETQVYYEGVYRWAERPPVAPRVELPPYTVTDDPHPAYAEGLLFHGPTLRGMRNVLDDSGDHLVIGASLPETELAHGAYAGRSYGPCRADVLLQAAALLARACHGRLCFPASADRIELFAPLPGEPFVITARLDSHSVLEMRCTVTACALDGRVLQRWTGLTMLPFAEERLVARLTAPRRALGDGGGT